jgi:hypothetical protein
VYWLPFSHDFLLISFNTRLENLVKNFLLCRNLIFDIILVLSINNLDLFLQENHGNAICRLGRCG